MLLNDTEIQNNIDEFVEAHGVEGFFRVYFREYLFQLLNEEIEAATNDPELDSALQLHFSQNVETDQELEEFEEQPRDQCINRADELVEGSVQIRLKDEAVVIRGDLCPNSTASPKIPAG